MLLPVFKVTKTLSLFFLSKHLEEINVWLVQFVKLHFRFYDY